MKYKAQPSPHSQYGTQDYPRPADTSDIPRDIVDNIRINPEKRICPSYDYLSSAEYRVAARDRMGVRVVDNCAQEHIM